MAPLDQEDLVRAVAMALSQVELARSGNFPGGSLNVGGTANAETSATIYTTRVGRTSEVSLGDSGNSARDFSSEREWIDRSDASGSGADGYDEPGFDADEDSW